jgi:hypothetical protein
MPQLMPITKQHHHQRKPRYLYGTARFHQDVPYWPWFAPVQFLLPLATRTWTSSPLSQTSPTKALPPKADNISTLNEMHLTYAYHYPKMELHSDPIPSQLSPPVVGIPESAPGVIHIGIGMHPPIH